MSNEQKLREALLSDMDIAVLRMPVRMAFAGDMAQFQYHNRVQALLNRIEALALPTAEQVDDINVAESFTSAAPDMPPQLRKIHPLDFPLEVFLADLTTRPAKIIRAEMLSFTRTDGAYDIEPPLTVRHLCMFSRNEMRKWPQMGKKSLNEIEETLRDRGLHLWENHDERSLRLLREHKDYFK